MKKTTYGFQGKSMEFRNCIRTKLKNMHDDSFDFESFLKENSKKEIAKILVDRLDRSQIGIRENIDEFKSMLSGHYFLADGTETYDDYIQKAKNGKLKDKDYEKILLEIEKNGSILPNTSKRTFHYGGGGGSVILSETTGKMYCVEDPHELSDFLEDYKGRQYYQSRSGASGEGYFLAGKKNIIDLQTSRIDTRNPREENSWREMNGLWVTAWSNRGVVDRCYPITMKNKKDPNTYIFVDADNVLDTINIIKSGGILPENYKEYSYNIGKYVDENGDYQELQIKYISDKEINSKIIRKILQMDKYSVVNKSKSYLQETGSEFDRVIGIFKIGDNFVEKGKDGIARNLVGNQHPLKGIGENSDLFEYVVGPGGELNKEFFGLTNKQIRGRNFLSDRIAYRKQPTGDYTVMVNYDFDFLGLSENAKGLFKYFPINHVLGSGTDSFQEKFYDLYVSSTSAGGSIVFMTDNITEDGSKKNIEKVANVLLRQDEYAQDIYEQNLKIAFNETFNLAREGKNYLKGRESYNNLIYTIFGDKVYLGYIIKNSNLNPKFSVLGGLQDYEKVISKQEFESNAIEYREDYMRRYAYDKSAKNYLNFRRWSVEKQVSNTKSYLLANLDKNFFIEDSLVTGNCLPGTQNFMETYNLNEGITAKEILQHQNLDQMLNDSRFRNVFLNKIELDLIDE